MFKTLLFLVKLAFFVAIVAWFTLNPGVVTIDWFDLQYKVHIGIAALGIVVLAVACMVVLHLVLLLRRLPEIWKDFFAKRQEKKGYESFTEAFIALSMEDLDTTREKILKTQRLLGDSPLPVILTALSAQKSNDHASATRAYGLLLKEKSTAFLGYYGLAQTAKSQRDHQAAYLYAKKSLELSPRSKWALLTLFHLSLRLKDYTGAFIFMKKIKKYSLVSLQKYNHFEGVYFYLQGCDEVDLKMKIKVFQKAFDAEPSFIPAALALGQGYWQARKSSKAEKTLQMALKITPHPELADLYMQVCEKESPREKIETAEELLLYTGQDSVVGHATLAKVAIKERFSAIARNHLELAILNNTGISPKLNMLAHQLEDLTDEDSKFSPKQSLYQPVIAKPDDTWQCTSCLTPQNQWEFVCPECDEMDTLTWQEFHFTHIPAKNLSVTV